MAYSTAAESETQARPTVQIVGATAAEDASRAQADAALVERNKLEIQALLHDLWLRQLQHRRGLLHGVTAEDIKILQLMQQALESISPSERVSSDA